MKLSNYFRLLAEDRAYGAGWFWRPFLQIGSLFYGCGQSIHQGCYQSGFIKRKSFDHPVISVGNITWGGTGKTPLVEYIARFYINRGNVPLILSRGYGQDETRAIAKQLPEAKLAIGSDRYKAAQAILSKNKVDVIILDDGFQHWPIKRDLDIVAVNVLNPFGNSSLIPRGILREPLTALKRASVVVLTDVNLASRKELDQLKTQIRKFNSRVEFVEAYREALYFYRPGNRERIQPSRLEGERVTTFSGIGTPRSFQMLLNQIGLKTIRNFEFLDHHQFSDRELTEIVEAKDSSKSEEIITTEKDFFRADEAIKKIVNPLVLKTRLHLTTGETLLHQYLARFTKPRSFERDNTKRFQERNRNNAGRPQGQHQNRPFRDNRHPRSQGQHVRKNVPQQPHSNQAVHEPQNVVKPEVVTPPPFIPNVEEGGTKE